MRKRGREEEVDLSEEEGEVGAGPNKLLRGSELVLEGGILPREELWLLEKSIVFKDLEEIRRNRNKDWGLVIYRCSRSEKGRSSKGRNEPEDCAICRSI